GDPGGPPDVVVVAGHRQAALLGLGFAFGGDDRRIDENLQVVARFADVDDDDPLVYVDLGRGQAYARGGVHGFGHVGDQFTDVGGHRGDRGGVLAQPGIGVLQDVQNHNYL